MNTTYVPRRMNIHEPAPQPEPSPRRAIDTCICNSAAKRFGVLCGNGSAYVDDVYCQDYYDVRW